MKETFITQDTGRVSGLVMVSLGGIPVIRINEDNVREYEYVSAIVNFLRCGCPAVQLLFIGGAKMNTDLYIFGNNLCANYLFQLKKHKETFVFQVGGGTMTITSE